jgi:hypothetical protein
VFKRNVFRIGKYLSDNLPIQIGRKQGHALSPLLFNFVSEYAMRKVQENQVGLKLNGTHQLRVYVNYVTLLGGNINTITESTQTLIDTSKGTCREVTPEKQK